MLKSICFQQVHWQSVVSRTCRRSQRATSIARRLPRQRRQENGQWMALLHDFLQRSVATWKRVNHWWSLPVFSQVKWVFYQFRRCLSCKVQMDQPSASRAERGTKAKTEAQLLCLTLSWYPKIGYLLSRSVGAVSSLTVAALHRYVYQVGFCHPTGPLSSGFPVDALWTRPVWKFFSWAGWHGSRRDWSGGGYILKPWPPQTWM